GAPQGEREEQRDVPRVEVRTDREREEDDDDRGRQRAAPIGPLDGPQEEEDRRAAPDEPRDVPWQERPRRKDRQHPWGVDVRQERPGRVVWIAAVEPDPDGGPVGPRVDAGRVTPRDHARPDDPADEDEQAHRDDPPTVVEARHLAADGAPEDTRAAAGSDHRDGHARGFWHAGPGDLRMGGGSPRAGHSSAYGSSVDGGKTPLPSSP